MAVDYVRTAPPSWVLPVAVPQDVQTPADQIVSGSHVLLHDRQIRMDGTSTSTYVHIATLALNEQGVASIANIEIGFDPVYQSLRLHDVRVHRKGQTQNRSASLRVEILRREKDLDLATLDGRVSAHIVLNDVRTGDVVEYAYTLSGRHPALGRHDAGMQQLAFGIPVEHQHLRLLLPSDRSFRWTVSNGGPAPVESMHDGQAEYVWSLRKVAAMPVESDAPGWFVPYPLVQWTSFSNWNDVARWGETLYRSPPQPGAAVEQRAARIAREYTGAADRLAESLRLAQRDVRYFGVQVGVSSLKPASPDEVLLRGFGDCKGKTLLLLTLLRRLGIQADAALVSTQLSRGIEGFLPSHLMFDHVLVRATIDGKTYWVDPTRATQLASLDRLYQPDFGRALVLRADTAGLTAMAGTRMHSRRVVTAIDAREGLEAPVRYTVSTSVSGALAEDLRLQLARDSADNVQKNYLNYYARYYPGIRVVRAMEVSDDIAGNRITTTEHYEIADFWAQSAHGARREVDVIVPELIDFLRRPATQTRHSPLPLAPNFELDATTDIALPGDWSIAPEQHEVKDAHFTYRRDIRYGERRLTLHDRLWTHGDHVPPEQLVTYVASLDRARSATAYSLLHTNVSKLSLGDRMNWPIAMIALLSALALIFLARRLYRYDPPAPDFTPVPGLQGLRGWLILPAIHMLFQPLKLGIQIASIVDSYSIQNWNALTQPGSPTYHALWAPLLLYEILANLSLVTAWVLAAVLFFKRRSSAPRVIIVTVWLSPVLMTLDDMMVGIILPDKGQAVPPATIAGMFVGAAVWTAYLLMSDRVKSTFRTRLRADAVTPVIVADTPAVPDQPIAGAPLVSGG
ncbi:DUF3857 domain-containing protein [Methyloversatilis thermotolerans]|uniref:DUF3857 domain-containing protein n=1 Tax=Methyloversatilis thermotolerans TaxID=1346290 RepID=UPI001E3402B5|nr:DUF3857 domain-containing protein [Methyloversatilis thermotolerans]